MCKDTATADIVYALSPAGSADAVDQTLSFFRQLTSRLDVAADRIHVGMVPKDCVKPPQFNFDRVDTKSNMLAELERYLAAQPTVASVLRYMRRQGFSAAKGGRRDAKRIGILFVDESDDLMRTKHEARRARDVSDIELFVVAVGKKFNTRKLRNIASQPTDEHLFIVPSYDHLPGMLRQIQESVCPPVGS